MNWDEDIDFMANKKSGGAKQGRRAGMSRRDEVPFEEEIPLKPKTGKWGDEGSKSASKTSTNLIEQERFQEARQEDSDDDIPVIPDMDDIQEEILTLHEVKTPMVSVKKATYKELDSELVSLNREQKLSHSGNINLSFLSSRLYPAKDIKEVDELWTMEDLFDNLINYNNQNST